MTHRTAVLLSLANAALLVAGCRQLVGIEDSPVFQGTTATGAGGGGGAGGGASTCAALPLATGACQACVATSCCAEAAACAADADCARYATCLGACASGDDTCESACRDANHAGDDTLAAGLRSCEGTACAAACGLSCGGYVYGGDACAACSRDLCCDKATACGTHADCAKVAACERQCAASDDECVRLCELTYPDGVTTERDLGACTTSSCPMSCFTPQWQCLATPHEASGSGNVSVTFSFHDFVAPPQAIAGASVQVCSNSTLIGGCPLDPLAQKTDANGAVTVSIKTSTNYVQLTADGYEPVLIFLPPLDSDVRLVFPIPNASTFQAFYDTVDRNPVTVVPDLGAVIAQVFDCLGGFAPGVTLSIDPSGGTSSFNFNNELPDTEVKVTDSAFGAGGFVDVMTGTAVHVGGTVVANGLTLPPQTLFTRGGALSLTVLYANPP